MKKSILIVALGLFSLNMMTRDAPKEEGFVFTTVKENPITSVKNQDRSSTCWNFSNLGFLESGLLRMGKGEYGLSKMFVVHHTMVDRAQNYVRYHGDNSFSSGSNFYDIMFCLKNYGLVPQEVMPGIMYGDTLPVHNKLDAVAGAYTSAVAEGKLTKLSPVWEDGLNIIYDAYLGKCPEKFICKGEEYTSETFDESLGTNPDDYMSLTSYIHHPFYTQFVIEIQDNWHSGLSWNLPINRLMAVMDNAVEKDYTFAQGSGVSEQGLTHDGIAVMPGAARDIELTGSGMARWTGLTAADRRKELTGRPLPKVNVTQEIRQAAFDNQKTTDDHGMVIYGVTRDQNGKEYFMVKSSRELSGKYKGIWYASKALVAYKTMNILIHRDVLSKDIAKKLGPR